MTFPFKLIKTEEEYQNALERTEEIFDSKPGTVEFDELELLVRLIEMYEDEHYPIEAPNPIAAIEFRMEQLGMKQRDMIPYFGSAPRVSEVLQGKRHLTIKMIRSLNKSLGIPLESLIN